MVVFFALVPDLGLVVAIDGGVDVCAKRTLFAVIKSVRNRDRKRTTNTANSKEFLFFTHISK